MSDAARVRPVVSPVDEALERAATALSAAPAVALAGHFNPDPDAIGSMLGLAGFLRSRGVEVGSAAIASRAPLSRAAACSWA